MPASIGCKLRRSNLWALEEDHLQDQGCDCGERQCCQGIYNHSRDPPAARLGFLATPKFIELVGLSHIVSPERNSYFGFPSSLRTGSGRIIPHSRSV
jgi:hypothetical protein